MLHNKILEAHLASADAVAAALADAAIDYASPMVGGPGAAAPGGVAGQPVSGGRDIPAKTPARVAVPVVLPPIRPTSEATIAELQPRDDEDPTSEMARVRDGLRRALDPKVGMPWTGYGANAPLFAFQCGVLAASLRSGTQPARLLRRVQEELPRALRPLVLTPNEAKPATAPQRAQAFIDHWVRDGKTIPVLSDGSPAFRTIGAISGLDFLSDLQNPTVRRKFVTAALDHPGEVVDASVEPGPAQLAEWVDRTIAIIEWHVAEKVPFTSLADFPDRHDRKVLAAEVGPDVPTLDYVWPVEKAMRAAKRLVGLTPPNAMGCAVVTAEQLMNFGLDRFRTLKKGNDSVEVGARGKKSALNWYLTTVGCALHADPRPHFGSALDANLERHGASRNQRSLLRAWDEDLRLMTADRLGGLSPKEVLRALMKGRGVTARDLAKLSGVPAAKIEDWRSGRIIMSASDHRDIAVLERALEAPEGVATSLVRGRRRRRPRADERALAAIPSEVRRHLGHDAASCSPEELAERRRFVEEHIVNRPTKFSAVMRMADTKGARAQLPDDAPCWSEMALLRAFKCTPIQLEGERGSTRWSDSTADMNMTVFERIMRLAHTPYEEGGLGQPVERLSLALLCNHRLLVSEAMERSRRLARASSGDWRRGMILTSCDLQNAIACASPFRPGVGWIWKNPWLAQRLVADPRPIPHLVGGEGRLAGLVPHGRTYEVMPEELVARALADWHGFCEQVYRHYRQLVRDIAAIMEAGRDPFENIGALIALPVPLSGLLRLVYSAEERMPDRLTSGSLWRMAMRAQVAMRIGTITFLRSKNLRELTYLDDQSGQLRYVDGEWHVVIPWRRFKNARSRDLFGPEGSKMDYHRVLPNIAGLYPLLEAYVREALPPMRQPYGGSPYLFPTKTAPLPTCTGMHSIVQNFTRDHCVWNPYTGVGMPGLQAFGVHALRDIGATTVLKDRSNPHRIREAADLLQTSPEMVVRRYAKLDVSQRLGMTDGLIVEASDAALGKVPLWRS